MCKQFDYFMEHHWTIIMDELSEEQRRAIAGDLECGSQEDEIYNKIRKQGSEGLHKFAVALVVQVRAGYPEVGDEVAC